MSFIGEAVGHLYDAIGQERRSSKHEDDRLNAMILVLVFKLIKKGILSHEEAEQIALAENIFEELNKEVKKK